MEIRAAHRGVRGYHQYIGPDSANRVAFTVLAPEAIFVASTSVSRPAGTTGASTTSLLLDERDYRMDAAALSGALDAPVTVATASAPFAAEYDQATGARQMPRLVTSRHNAQCLVIGDWLYVLGGSDGITVEDTVERARIDASGHLGVFQALGGAVLPSPRYSFGSAVIG